jgi:hypothetical protein
MTKLERKKYGLLSPKVAESDTNPLVMVCLELLYLYDEDTSQNTLSACTHNDRSKNISQVGLKLLKPQISQQHLLSSRICFITPVWQVTRDLNLLSLTMGKWTNLNVSSNKSLCMTIMALKPKQLQVTTYHPQSKIERIHKLVNVMLRSFDLENNHENLEEQEDNPFDYFLQSCTWLPSH